MRLQQSGPCARALRTYTIGLAALSLSIAWMPTANRLKASTTTPMYAVGALFWLGLITAIVMAVRIHRTGKNDAAFHKRRSGRPKWGLLCFFQNKKAAVADTVMIATAVALAVACFTAKQTAVYFWLFAVLAFSVGMHGMLNGTDYRYIEFERTVRRG